MNAGWLVLIAIGVVLVVLLVCGPVYEAIRDHRNRFGGGAR
jgi:hypothetical protein